MKEPIYCFSDCFVSSNDYIKTALIINFINTSFSQLIRHSWLHYEIFFWWQSICKPARSLPLHSFSISFSKIQTTQSYFHQRTASAYHQKADQEWTTHAYTIGQEMTVSKSMVKPSLINVGTMKAKLSLWGILNQWHLHCLCWGCSQKSRTPIF